MIDISNALIKRYKNAPTIEQVNDPISYRNKIGPGEDNAYLHGLMAKQVSGFLQAHDIVSPVSVPPEIERQITDSLF